MSVAESKEVEEPSATFRQRCVDCIRGPNLMKTLVVIVCTVIVVQQITACVKKLIRIPITTYTHFDFNETILYPSVTFCREPSYKYDKMEEYGLYAHPRQTSIWSDFNFSAVTLDQLWEDTTYTAHEYFKLFGLSTSTNDVDVQATTTFMFGRCYTVSPRAPVSSPTWGSGYSLTLLHTATDIVNNVGVEPPGYHVFVHYNKEPFTEVNVFNGGLVDYLYVNMGDTVHVKLEVDEYIRISRSDDQCYDSRNYSANACTTKCVWDLVGNTVGCSGPWMLVTGKPRCNNYLDMTALIRTYMNISQHHPCVCPRICRSYFYKAYVTNRQNGFTWDSARNQWFMKTGEAALESKVYMHFKTNMVSVYEERYNYDWNLFISDLGGSIGFLLGLSVIGLMAIFQKFWSTMIRPVFKGPKMTTDAISVTSSTVTTDMKNFKKDENSIYVGKFNEWNLINDLYNNKILYD